MNTEYFMPEIRDGFKVTEERKRLWNTELEILCAFQKICDKHDLHYFLIGGAAIGVERHRGFIPWDDDMDLGMLRKDFETFLEVAKEELPSEYYLQYGVCEKDMFSPLLRIRDGRTTGITNADRKSKANQGIFIEIYPFDNVPNNKMMRKIQLLGSKIMSNVLHARFYDLELSRISFIANKLFCKKTNQEVFAIWNRLSQRYNKKKTEYVDTVMLPIYALQGIHYFNAEGCKTRKACFEYLSVEVAVENDKFLRQQYGDYMQLPPLEERGTHHDTVVFYDPYHSYTYWIGNPELEQKFKE